MVDKLIRIHQKTFERLSKHGKFGDSIDDVINKILNDLEKKR